MVRLLMVLLLSVVFAGHSAAESLSIATVGYPAATPTALYAADSKAVGGTPPYAWHLAAGTLPAGLSLATDGTISGTPSAAGRSSFTVAVTDSLGAEVEGTFSIDVFPRKLVYDGGFNDGGTAVAIDGAGHFYVAGYASNGTNNDYHIIKYNTDGSMAWLRQFDSGGEDVANGVAVDSGGNVYVVGSPRVIKYNAAGGEEWSKDFGAAASAVTLDSAGNIYVGGPTGSYTSLIRKYDSAGEIVWSINHSSGCTGLALDSTGNIIVASTYDLSKYNNAGTFQWKTSLADGCTSEGTAAVDAADNIFVVRCSSALYKVSPSGAVLWTKSFDQYNGAAAAGIVVKGDDIFITGSCVNTQSVFYGTYRYKTDGTFLWKDSYLGGGYSYPAAIALNPAGDTIVVTGKAAPVWGQTTPTDIHTIAYLIPKIAPVADVSVKPGVHFSMKVEGSGGVAPRTWSASFIAGMTYDAATGVISGVPTDPGIHQMRINLTDSNRTISYALLDSKWINFTVYGITSYSVPSGTVRVPYTASVQVAGGVSPLTWSISGGSLPPGLSLDPASGAITGTPTDPGTWTFTATVVDAEGTPDSQSYTTSVFDPVQITDTSIRTIAYYSPYSYSLSATGGKAPLTWSIVGGTLASSMSIVASSGYISGQATQTGTQTLSVKVQDSIGNSDTQTFSVPVVVLVNIPYQYLATGTVDFAYRGGVYAGDGAPPYTFSIESNTLPDGLSLDSSTGLITGAPTTSGTYNVLFKVTDSANYIYTRSLPLTVQPKPSCSPGPVGIKNMSTGTYTDYADIRSAYDAAFSNAELRMQTLDLMDSLTFDRNIPISLFGGLDCYYYSITGLTTIHGTITIASGTVTLDSIAIM